MSKISILDITALNQSDSFLTELSENELQVSGGGHCYGHKGGRGGSSSGGSNNKHRKGKGRGGSSSGGRGGSSSGGGGGRCHPCW